MTESTVQMPDALEACCRQLAQCPRFGLDMEFVGEQSYHPELCLIQVATPDALFLIDPFAFESLDAFWNVAVDPARQVIVHAGREEVRLCHLWCGRTPGQLFDLQIAAGLAGLPYPLSHGALVHEVLGHKLTKGETLTEWRTRPLTKAQIRYAFDDVRFLLPAWEKLSAKLDALGRRAWAEEEFARLRELATPDDDGIAVSADKWRRMKGAGALDRRRLALLRELFFWREQAAVEANKPPRVIVRDDLLVEIVRRNPKSVQDLQPVRGLAKRHLSAIVATLEKARALPADEHPHRHEREQDPPQVAVAVNLLSAYLAHLAEENQVAGNLVASSQDLRAIVRARWQGKKPPAHLLLLQGWRAQHFLLRLQAMLEGRVWLRLTGLDKEVPIECKED